MSVKLKSRETIGCCGIDCGLCPRFYTKGDSACPGCGGENFSEKHPSCGILTCCAIKNRLEVCALCAEFPCARFNREKVEKDSFVTHWKIFLNHSYIKAKGLGEFLAAQRIRVNILNELLTHFDHGRLKSFYCVGCALLPTVKLQEIIKYARQIDTESELRVKCKLVKEFMQNHAISLSIDLRLDK